jgi:hypothetical protein
LVYLLDASALITGERDAYPLRRFRIFWEWLEYCGGLGQVKIPAEQYEEIVAGNGELVDWLKHAERRSALLLNEEASVDLVRRVVTEGYADDLDDNEIARISGDAFLISYALVSRSERTIVTFEVSSPRKLRANRKVPDVCASLNVPCCTLYNMVDALDFTTDWTP